MTTKGELVRAILFPPPLDLAFYDDFLKSVRVFLVLGLIGMAYSLYMWISIGVSGTALEFLDFDINFKIYLKKLMPGFVPFYRAILLKFGLTPSLGKFSSR